MTPELQAALEWAEADNDKRWQMCGLDPNEWCSTLANTEFGRRTNAAWSALSAELRRREAMTCETCLSAHDSDTPVLVFCSSLQRNVRRDFYCAIWDQKPKMEGKDR
jgi:hypothetical protein